MKALNIISYICGSICVAAGFVLGLFFILAWGVM